MNMQVDIKKYQQEHILIKSSYCQSALVKIATANNFK